MHVLRGRPFLPARLPQQPRLGMAARLGRGREKLEAGARVADVGCGHGWSTVLMAKAFPRSTFVGYDFHPGSIEEAQAHAEMHGVSANTRFEVGLAKDFP